MITSLLALTIAGRSVGGWLKLAGVVLAALVPIVAYFFGRKAGGSAERERQQRATLDAIRRMQDADAQGPHSSDDAIARAKDGTF